MNEEVKLIMQYLDSEEADPRTIELMIDNKLVSSTATRDLKLVFHYRRVLQEKGSRQGACYDVSERLGVSDSTLLRARRKYEHRK